MIDYFRRLTDQRGLPPLPDDDETIEARYPKVRWAEHVAIRKMQRKCFMRAEHMRAHPELYPVSLDERRRERTIREVPAPRIAAPSTSQEPFDFAGIEDTAPVAVRRQNG